MSEYDAKALIEQLIVEAIQLQKTRDRLRSIQPSSCSHDRLSYHQRHFSSTHS